MQSGLPGWARWLSLTGECLLRPRASIQSPKANQNQPQNPTFNLLFSNPKRLYNLTEQNNNHEKNVDTILIDPESWWFHPATHSGVVLPEVSPASVKPGVRVPLGNQRLPLGNQQRFTRPENEKPIDPRPYPWHSSGDHQHTSGQIYIESTLRWCRILYSSCNKWNTHYIYFEAAQVKFSKFLFAFFPPPPLILAKNVAVLWQKMSTGSNHIQYNKSIQEWDKKKVKVRSRQIGCW